jgi:hypothetical protein
VSLNLFDGSVFMSSFSPELHCSHRVSEPWLREGFFCVCTGLLPSGVVRQSMYKLGDVCWIFGCAVYQMMVRCVFMLYHMCLVLVHCLGRGILLHTCAVS